MKLLPLYPYRYRHHSEVAKARKENPKSVIRTFPKYKVFMVINHQNNPLLPWKLSTLGPVVEVVDFEELTGKKVPEVYSSPKYLRDRLLIDHNGLLKLCKDFGLSEMYHCHLYLFDLTYLTLQQLGVTKSVTIHNPPDDLVTRGRKKFPSLSVRREGKVMNLTI